MRSRIYSCVPKKESEISQACWRKIPYRFEANIFSNHTSERRFPSPQRKMRYDFEIRLNFQHRIVFEESVFSFDNQAIIETLEFPQEGKGRRRRVVVLLEKGVAEAWPDLSESIREKVESIEGATFRGVHVLLGGEDSKKTKEVYEEACSLIAEAGIDRHSYVFAIGGGAFLDVVGFAATTVHRGVRLVRFPTTTLSQDDSGVGVKSGVNLFGKKNFLGAFAVPYAVINDFSFLASQSPEVRLDGLVEAIKVALVKDASFFNWLEEARPRLAKLEPEALKEAVERSAVLHARHIAEGGDPFEMGSSRPLDFGHWAAHKLEQLSEFRLSHARAVSVGLALDCLYAVAVGYLAEKDCDRVLNLLAGLGLPLWADEFELRDTDGRRLVYQGLEEFREHLGGELTILLLKSAGQGVEVHTMDEDILDTCVEKLAARETEKVSKEDSSLLKV